MAFKLKKTIDEILQMDFESYAKYLKKEISRAAKLGELDVVVCGSHTFKSKGKDKGKTSSLILFGAFTGELAKFFKDNKTTIGFARGKCFFESTKNGVILHIALNQGKGKPDKIKKSGKNLWAKLGMDAQLYEGALPLLSQDLDAVNIGEQSLLQEADLSNNDQAIELVLEQYQKAKKALQEQVLPLINNKETSDDTYTNQHFKIAKTTLTAAASFLNKFKELESEQLKSEELESEQQEGYQKKFNNIQKNYPAIKRITAKIKKALMASNAVDITLDNTKDVATETENIQNALTQLKIEFERLEQLKTEAEEAIKFLTQPIQ
jgi:hypothetical protein